MAAVVDTNVVLDLLAKREPWHKAASDLLFLAAQGKAHLFLSGSTVTDLYYLINKHVYRDAEQSKTVILKLLDFFSVVDVGYADCCFALGSGIDDYEDAVLAEATRRAGIDCIVTRDKADYRNAPMRILSPKEYLETLLEPTALNHPTPCGSTPPPGSSTVS
jgi:predicted nucleic acid-binding protein